MPLRVVRSGALPPALNMGLDEALLVTPGPSTLRLYSWDPPGVSLGYFQASGPAAAVTERHDLVRRLTGGGAIHHDREITFALTADLDLVPHGVEDLYVLIHDAVASALRRCGVAARRVPGGPPTKPRPDEWWCFAQAGAFDLVTPEGRKIVGSAQRRTRRPHRRVLHHGSVVLSVPSGTPGCGAVDQQADLAQVTPTLWRALPDEIANALGLPGVTATLTQTETALGEELARTRYDDDAFTLRR
ncbi:MAG: hypothetical protein AAF628_15255 [Planctomycetota bacterium]